MFALLLQYISSGWGIINFQYWIFRLTLEEVFEYLSVSIRCAVLTNNCTSNTIYSVMSFLKFTLKYPNSEQQGVLQFSSCLLLTALKLLVEAVTLGLAKYLKVLWMRTEEG